MTEHKYTDEEVIKALECCANIDCLNCPRRSEEWTSGMCNDFLSSVLDLIKRQRAEIDDLKRDTIPKLQWSLQRANEMGAGLEVELRAMRGAANSYKMHYENAKAEAIKEFAERLKKEAGYFGRAVVVKDIDDLAEELTAPKRCPDCKYFAWCECFNGPCDLFEREE